MFDNLRIYHNKGNCIIENGEDLSKIESSIPNLPGVFYMLRLANGSVDMVYIGKTNHSKTGKQIAFDGIQYNFTGKKNIKTWKEFFEKKFHEENIDAIDIYWFVTFNNETMDLPEFVHGQILQQYFNIYSMIPEWNGLI